jgi:hypothetical protein
MVKVKGPRGMHLIAASGVSALSSENVLVALRATGNPEALATRLPAGLRDGH